MSMHVLTVLQIIYITLLYLLVIVGCPAVAVGRYFKKYPFAVRFMAYLVIGNAYVINVVFLLQLLHISNRITLFCTFLIPALVLTAVLNWKYWFKESLVSAGETTHSVLSSTMGFRLLLVKVFGSLGTAIANLIRYFLESLRTNWVDWTGSVFVALMVLWQYGTNAVNRFGYMASDTPVHNYWINAFSRNDIFVAGVYPHGFHCLIYFFHEIFGIEVFVMLRLYAVLQTTLIYMLLLCFLRTFCKLPMLSYLATTVYAIADIWGENTYCRYFFTLPQEYGMIFILPSIAFLLLFLRERRDENGAKGWRLGSTKMIAVFTLSFSLTLAVHFYDTIAAGLFCVAIAIGFAARVFRKEYFGRILGFGILSIVLAVLPMAIAVMCGKPLEGSLRWGLSILRGSAQNAGYEQTVELAGVADDELTTAWNAIPVAEKRISRSLVSDGQKVVTAGQSTLSSSKMIRLLSALEDRLGSYIFIKLGYHPNYLTIILIPALIICGILVFLLKDKEYGSLLISIATYTGLLCTVMVSDKLGLPMLMDNSRCSMYLGYAIPLFYAMVLDLLLISVVGFLKSEDIKKLVPVILLVICVIVLGKNNLIRKAIIREAFETNGAITSVTNILRENKPQTFTIVSANDELRMVEEYGYHYEVNELLIKCMGNSVYGYESIPTPKVYVFVEKKPLKYALEYTGHSEVITLDDAMKPLPIMGGIAMYQGDARHILMSKLYCWAQAFCNMYPNETSVYYEDDEFICYEIRQNVYRPFDLTIDYGYNNSGIELD